MHRSKTTREILQIYLCYIFCLIVIFLLSVSEGKMSVTFSNIIEQQLKTRCSGLPVVFRLCYKNVSYFVFHLQFKSISVI